MEVPLTVASGFDRPYDGELGLGGVLLSGQTLEALLGTVIDVAAASLPGLGAASVTVRRNRGRKLATITAISERARHVDERQYSSGVGPCLEAMDIAAEVEADLPSDRWPAFSEAAMEAGFHRIWSLPLRSHGGTLGSLNLYYTDPQVLDEVSVGVSRVLARQAAVVLANAADLADAQTQNASLQQALEGRTIIGQAQGILMARQGIDAAQAFDTLRRGSQRTNRKLRDIAAEIVTSALQQEGPGHGGQ